MIMQIELTELQSDTLKMYATANNVTEQEYAMGIISSWVNSQIDGFYIDKIKKMDKDELKTKLGKMEV